MNDTEAIDLLKTMLHQVAPEVDLRALTPDTELQFDLDLDSMDFLNIVAAVHERTGIDIPERDYPELLTVGSFASYVAAHAA